MYSADRHGHWDEDAFKEPKDRSPGWTEKKEKGDMAVIMLEMKNDLLTDRTWRAQFTQRLVHILGSDSVVALVNAKRLKNSSTSTPSPSSSTSPSTSG
jgi:hypothetical protein